MEAGTRRRVEAVRSFNRLYTSSAGLITDNLLDTPHTLTEARVLFELDDDGELPAGELSARVGLDPGYLSRVASRLEGEGLLRRRRCPDDARRQLLSLTDAGARRRSILDRRSAESVRRLLDPLPEERAEELVGAMRTIGEILSPAPGHDGIVLRPPRPGDLGWVVQRHGELYAREYGWNRSFEALVAGVIASFGESADPARNAAWIAELNGRRVGSILCVAENERTAKLRLLLVEPQARGRGIGRLLVAACVDFARDAGFEELTLWTNDVLTHARPIYEAAGFELSDSEPHRMFGPEVVGQTWRLALVPAPRR